MVTRSRGGSSGQKIWTRSSRQDRARPKRSTGQIGTFHFGETSNRSTHIAHFRQDRPIPRPDRTDPNARSTQDNYLLSEDFRTAKTPIPKTNRDRCDSRSRSRHLQIEIAATQDQDRRTPVRGVKISAPEANAQPQTLSEIDISQGRYEELKPAQPTGTQGEHKVIQQGTDRSTPSVSRQVWASGRSTLTKVIL